jgi:hypothetical protein
MSHFDVVEAKIKVLASFNTPFMNGKQELVITLLTVMNNISCSISLLSYNTFQSHPYHETLLIFWNTAFVEYLQRSMNEYCSTHRVPE